MEKEYYVISLKWSKGEIVCFWRAEASGYTENYDEAGKYSQAEIDKHPSYYNDGVNTVAVECTEFEKYFRIKRVALFDCQAISRLKLSNNLTT